MKDKRERERERWWMNGITLDDVVREREKELEDKEGKKERKKEKRKNERTRENVNIEQTPSTTVMQTHVFEKRSSTRRVSCLQCPVVCLF